LNRWLVSGNVGSAKAGTRGAGSILAVGLGPGDDGVFFADDDETTGVQLGKIKYKYYETDNGSEAFGIIAEEFLKSKVSLPVVDGDFNIREQ
jgi:hypothetical protein